MFWMYVTPFLIAFFILFCSVITYVIFSQKLRQRRGKALVFSLIASVILFVPTCKITKYVLDKFRFGVFYYGTHNQINDIRVDRNIPVSAGKISIEKNQNGFNARYSIEGKNLFKWFEEFGKKQTSYDIKLMPGTIGFPTFQSQFSHLGWIKPSDLKPFGGYFDSGGAGFYIWFSEKEKKAYELGADW